MKKRILFYSEAWGIGGIENFIMNLARNLDKEEYQVDIFTTWDSNNAYDEELSKLRARRATVSQGHRPNLFKRQIEGTQKFGQLLARHHYDIVHINTMNGMGFTYAVEAKRRRIKTIIVHSHNSAFGEGHTILKTVGHLFGKYVLGRSATMRLTCDDKAGHYLFGNRPFTIIQNGIDTDKFSFDQQARVKIRNELGLLKDTFVLGSISRITYQKNPLFSLEVFAELHKVVPKSIFVMVGSGDMDTQVEEKIRDLGLEAFVIRVPRTTVPQEYYSAFDAFISAPVFEGLGQTAIEAQCSGLPLICSDAYPEQIIITSLVKRLSLDLSVADWGRELVEYYTKRDVNLANRQSYKTVIEQAGYSSRNMVVQVEKIYREA